MRIATNTTRLCVNSLLLLSGVFPILSPASTFHVDDSVSQSGDGSSWATAFRTVQEGINAAGAGDTVVIAPATYQENLLLKGNPITLTSVDPDDAVVVSETILEGSRSTSVLVVPAVGKPGCSIVGLTITHGEARRGGGICCDPGCILTVKKSSIIDNYATERGGGIFASSSAVAIEDCSIRYNSAPVDTGDSWDRGGGICSEDSSLTVLNTLIDHNTAESGGGIACEGGALTIRGSEITSNVADSDAGLSCLFMDKVVLRGNYWISNKGQYGGCLYWVKSRVCLVNNVLVGNEAAVRAGAILDNGFSSLIANNTIVYNTAPEGGAICLWHGSVAFIVNNVIWGNANSIYGASVGEEPVHCCIDEEVPGEGNIHLDPGFVDPDNGDYRLSPDSPCRNAGNTAAALEATLSPMDNGALISWSAGDDLNGNPRISSNAVDIGAYEYQEGTPNVEFLLEYSSDLKTWQSIEVGPVWEWMDEVLDSIAARFYRVGLR